MKKKLHFFSKIFLLRYQNSNKQNLAHNIWDCFTIFEDEIKFIDRNKYLSLENSKIGNEIRYSLKNIKYKDVFYLKKIDLEILKKINQIIDDIEQRF